ncbi:hypothetical protein WUBG_01633 [Wuchereria bancrofti]|uniref:Uncharacterized protein n=1 Tax=Wuchereria bancrofti TaxID=6293 RepID=J9EXV8_WUCBA|nr:hypothetical protein WUBG_01633 [Wuchereria bancrofti]
MMNGSTDRWYEHAVPRAGRVNYSLPSPGEAGAAHIDISNQYEICEMLECKLFATHRNVFYSASTLID